MPLNTTGGTCSQEEQCARGVSIYTCTLQVIHDWDAVEYERSTDALESAIKAAVQDALSETRNAGRAAFSAYSRARRDRVSAVLASVDNSLRQKLKEGLLEGKTV